MGSSLTGGGDWDGLFKFSQSSPPAMAGRRGLTEEEAGKWPAAIQHAMEKGKETYGGIYTEVWGCSCAEMSHGREERLRLL